jgi:gamma-glutamyltranspeptidase/glutathione hydrolase
VDGTVKRAHRRVHDHHYRTSTWTSTRTTVTPQNASDYSSALACPHSLGTAAGEAAIAAGGNALDAALAAAAVLTVVYPHNTSIGGDLFALVRDPSGHITSINASGPAARGTDVAAVRERYAGRMPVRGVDTVTVPGAVAGLGAVHGLGARLPWADAFTAAVRHAEDGVPVASSVAAAVRDHPALLDGDAGMRAVFHSGGRALGVGDLLRNPTLGSTLRLLAREGPGCLYGGRVGDQLIAGLQELGSVLTTEDLAAFTAHADAPLSAPYGEMRVWTCPPNSQGFMLLEILAIICALPPGMDLFGEDAYVLAAIFEQANLDRSRLLTDPALGTASIDEVLADPYVHRVAERVADRSRDGSAGSPVAVRQRPGGDTVAVVAADSDGWAVSLIQSLFESFGSGILELSTGIVLQNRGSFFSLDARSANVLAPGKRPAHTLMPAMVTRGDRLSWVMGTMGGRAQPQILTQVLLRAARGASASQAIEAPRLIIGGMEVDQPENTAHVEPGLGRTPELLAGHGLPVIALPDRDEVAGHAQLVSVSSDGVLDAASDPRSDGSSVVARRRRP